MAVGVQVPVVRDERIKLQLSSKGVEEPPSIGLMFPIRLWMNKDKIKIIKIIQKEEEGRERRRGGRGGDERRR